MEYRDIIDIQETECEHYTDPESISRKASQSSTGKKPLTIEETCKLLGGEIIPEGEIPPAIRGLLYFVGLKAGN